MQTYTWFKAEHKSALAKAFDMLMRAKEAGSLYVEYHEKRVIEELQKAS